MATYSVEQHVQMIKLYYQNGCSLVATIRALRPRGRILVYTFTDSGDVIDRSCVSLTYGCWLIVHWTGRLEFGHQTLNSRLGRTTVYTIKRSQRTNRHKWTTILIIKFYHLHVLLNAVTSHDDLSLVTEKKKKFWHK